MKCTDWPHFSPRSSSITCRCCTLRGGRPWPSARHTAHGQNATAVMQYLSPAITNYGTRLIPHSPMKRETAYVAGYDISRRPLLIGTASFVSEHALIIPARPNQPYLSLISLVSNAPPVLGSHLLARDPQKMLQRPQPIRHTQQSLPCGAFISTVSDDHCSSDVFPSLI